MKKNYVKTYSIVLAIAAVAGLAAWLTVPAVNNSPKDKLENWG